MTVAARRTLISPDSMYWALIDRRGCPTAGDRSRVVQEQLPAPLTELHLTFIPLDESRLAACAVPLSYAKELAASGGLTAGPGEFPRAIPATIDPASINILHGACTPRSLLRIRRATLASIFAAVLVCTAFLVLGFERRRERDDHAAALAYAEADRIAAETLGVSLPSPVSPPTRLRAELATARRSAATRQGPDAPTDASVALQSLLAACPPGADARLDSLSLSQGSACLSISVPDRAIAQDIATALAAARGFSPALPQVSRARDGFQVRLTLPRAESTR